jgi:pSer/pThr/pTyr-binding forkhead associated (FHA) protein
MWKLSIEDDQGNKTVVNLVRDEYFLGRAEDNTVRLTERNISRRHAKLTKDGTHWVLTDLGSYNGCFVNGVRVAEPQPLEHGDLVQLGDYRLEIVDSALTAGAGGQAATVPAAPRAHAMLGQPDRLVMLAGPTPGAEFPLVAERMVIGRGEDCTISINHSSVSRIHAEIQAVGSGRYELIDRESANGVRINGVELQRSLLDARDTIELGDVVLKFIPAGQIYRPGEESHQLSALLGGERPSPAPGVEAQMRSGVPSGVKLVAALVALGLLVVLGMVIGSQRGSTASPDVAAPVDGAARALAEAKSLLDRGELEAAHLKATRDIPEDSNARQSHEFREIEARWADDLFARAAAETDAARKRALLDRIAKATSVDSVRRKRAANEIAALDAEGVDVAELAELPNTPQPMAAAEAPPTTPAPVRRAATQPTAVKDGLVRKNPFDTGKTAAPAPRTSTQDDATSGDRAKLVRAKATLQAKASSGRATEQELRMLRALCRQLGDASCSN